MANPFAHICIFHIPARDEGRVYLKPPHLAHNYAWRDYEFIYNNLVGVMRGTLKPTQLGIP